MEVLGDKCPIWSTSAQLNGTFRFRNFVTVSSPRAGGRYLIDEEAAMELEQLDESSRMKLTTWLVDQRSTEIDAPRLTFKKIRDSVDLPLLTPAVRRDRLLLYFASRCPRLDDELEFYGPPESAERTTNDELLAHTESYRPQELFRLIQFSSDWLDNMSGRVRLTFKGWERVVELKRTQTTSEQAFVAMWFDASMGKVFDQGIGPGISDAGYKALRIDQKEHNNKIDDEIIAEIRRSRFVVADFTCGNIVQNQKRHALQRGGVYYEAGFAHGLGRSDDLTISAKLRSRLVLQTP